MEEATMGRHARTPLTGYLVDEASQGAYRDAWVETHAQITLRPLVPVSGMVLRGWRPIHRPAGFLSGTGAGLRQRFFHRDQTAAGRFHLLKSDAIPIQHRGHPFGRDGDAHFGHRAADDLDYLRCR